MDVFDVLGHSELRNRVGSMPKKKLIGSAGTVIEDGGERMEIVEEDLIPKQQYEDVSTGNKGKQKLKEEKQEKLRSELRKLRERLIILFIFFLGVLTLCLVVLLLYVLMKYPTPTKRPYQSTIQ